MKMQHSKNSLYGILSALMLLNVALLFPSSANAQYQSKLPKCEGSNSNRWDMCYGEETSRNGVNYKGEYKDGYRHGFGIITYGNNEKYVGQFAQGRNEGRGTLFGADGRKLKEGAWENNEFVEVSSAELEERRRKAELEKLQNDLAAAKKAQLEAERGKTDAENARRQAEANANAAKMRADSEQQRIAAAEQKRKAELDKQQLDLAAAKKAQLEAERGKADADNARRQAEANANAAKQKTDRSIPPTGAVIPESPKVSNSTLNVKYKLEKDDIGLTCEWESEKDRKRGNQHHLIYAPRLGIRDFGSEAKDGSLNGDYWITDKKSTDTAIVFTMTGSSETLAKAFNSKYKMVPWTMTINRQTLKAYMFSDKETGYVSFSFQCSIIASETFSIFVNAIVEKKKDDIEKEKENVRKQKI